MAQFQHVIGGKALYKHGSWQDWHGQQVARTA